MLHCAANAENMDNDIFAEMLDEIVLLLAGFGKALSMAFSDVKEKAEATRKNKKFLCEL